MEVDYGLCKNNKNLTDSYGDWWKKAMTHRG